jgi:hypothetical protein
MGKKINFIDHMSFIVKHTVTCICIERSVSNSRPMLCMGCKSGEIMIYYLDEPILNKVTGKPVDDGRMKEKLFKIFNFNISYTLNDSLPPNFATEKDCGISLANNQSIKNLEPTPPP